MDCEKRIAYIFREEKVFLTKDGRFFGFVCHNDGVKCHRLSEGEKMHFLARREKKKQIMQKLRQAKVKPKTADRTKFKETALARWRLSEVRHQPY